MKRPEAKNNSLCKHFISNLKIYNYQEKSEVLCILFLNMGNLSRMCLAIIIYFQAIKVEPFTNLEAITLLCFKINVNQKLKLQYKIK